LHCLIMDEVNIKEVKEVIVDKNIDTIEFDTKITPELKKEGMLRDIIRQIQSMRKGLGLKPVQRIMIGYDGSEKMKEVIIEQRERILSETKADSIKQGKEPGFDTEKELEVDKEKVWLAIKNL